MHPVAATKYTYAPGSPRKYTYALGSAHRYTYALGCPHKYIYSKSLNNRGVRKCRGTSALPGRLITSWGGITDQGMSQ